MVRTTMGSAGAPPGLAVEDATLVAGEAVRAGGEAHRAAGHQRLLDLRARTPAEAPSCASGLVGVPLVFCI